MYDDGGDRRLELFPGDDHALRGSAERAEEMLLEFVAACAGVEVGEEARDDVLATKLVEDCEGEDLMRRSGDLRSPERLE